MDACEINENISEDFFRADARVLSRKEMYINSALGTSFTHLKFAPRFWEAETHGPENNCPRIAQIGPMWQKLRLVPFGIHEIRALYHPSRRE